MIKLFKVNFCILLLFSSLFLNAQSDETDTLVENNKYWKITSPQNLADTLWNALKQKTDDFFFSLIPSVEPIKESFDSLEIKNNPQIIKIKHNYINYRLRKQYKALKIHARKNSLKFKQCQLNEVKTRDGKDEKGAQFSYVTMYCSKSKKEFTIKFVALKLGNYWYIGDELKLEMKDENPYYKPPVKVK